MRSSRWTALGVGTALLSAAADYAKTQGCSRLWLITTNDNTRAIRFYQRRGFVMTALHLNAIEDARRMKPQIPLTGLDDIPILHEIEFEKPL
ncbi:MAG TPA: GNAT family N-acetyltransferase [Feifaniaceae bacterium]|nr:GNAT family N-acetyltransferase [Feifaniaceae bacterium]